MDYENMISKIKKLAHEIDPRINLFEGFFPKKTDKYKGELLFWRQIVNIYGLLADCDPVQIKDKNNCLIELMLRYSLIERKDYDFSICFWKDVSNIRKWFCHNHNPALFYKQLVLGDIKNYLNNSFSIASKKPQSFETMNNDDWGLAAFSIGNRFDEYLNILHKGFSKWKESEYSEELKNEWIEIFATVLFGDRELFCNALAELAQYDITDQGLRTTVPVLVKNYKRTLENNGFSEIDIKNELCRIDNQIRSNVTIIIESIRNSYML